LCSAWLKEFRKLNQHIDLLTTRDIIHWEATNAISQINTEYCQQKKWCTKEFKEDKEKPMVGILCTM